MNDGDFFESTGRIVAIFPADVSDVFLQILGEHGVQMSDGDRMITTIGAFWDDTERTRMRAASLFDGTIQPIPLNDGRSAYFCLWRTTVVSLLEAGEIYGVEQLTDEQLLELTQQEE